MPDRSASVQYTAPLHYDLLAYPHIHACQFIKLSLTCVQLVWLYVLLGTSRVISETSHRLVVIVFVITSIVVIGCESWTLKKHDKRRISAFKMKCLRQVLRLSWMAKRTNDWVLETAGVSRSLLVSVKEMKLAYYGHVLRKKGDCLEK